MFISSKIVFDTRITKVNTYSMTDIDIEEKIEKPMQNKSILNNSETRIGKKIEEWKKIMRETEDKKVVLQTIASDKNS